MIQRWKTTEYTTRVGYMLEEKRTIAAAVAAAVARPCIFIY